MSIILCCTMSIILCSSLSTGMLRSSWTTTTTTTTRITRTTRTTRSSSWTTRTTRRTRTTWTSRTARTTRKTSPTTTTTTTTSTTTTMSSHLRYSMYPSLSPNLLSTKETLKNEMEKVIFRMIRSFGLFGMRSDLFKNLSSTEFVQEFTESMVKTFYINLLFYTY